MTPTAQAARDLLACIDNPTYHRVLEVRAILGGWVGARNMGCYDSQLSDSIATEALSAVLGLFRSWAAECQDDGVPSADEADRISGRTTGT